APRALARSGHVLEIEIEAPHRLVEPEGDRRRQERDQHLRERVVAVLRERQASGVERDEDHRTGAREHGGAEVDDGRPDAAGEEAGAELRKGDHARAARVSPSRKRGVVAASEYRSTARARAGWEKRARRSGEWRSSASASRHSSRVSASRPSTPGRTI